MFPTYKPEGMLNVTAENREALSSPEGLERALRLGPILEAPVLLCDNEMRLHVELGCMRGIIPREEAVWCRPGETIKDIAIITRVGKSVAFKIIGFGEEKGLEAVGVYRQYFSTKGLFENEVYKGIPEALEKLKNNGLTLAVSTSKPEVYAKQILEHFDLDKYFAEVCGIPLGDESMTKAQVIAQTLEKLEVGDKSQVLMVGDRDYDVKGAFDNGIECMGVLYGYGDEKELGAAGAKYIAATVEEMAELICNLG